MDPKFHVSEQKPDSKVGTHGNYVEEIPKVLMKIPKKYQINSYIMIEAKLKEDAVMRSLKKFFKEDEQNEDEDHYRLKELKIYA